MARDQTPESVLGLDRDTLRPGEQVTLHWSAPEGRGLLTNLRCLLLGHPHPIRRPLRWSVDLEQINALSVERFHDGFEGGYLTLAASLVGGILGR